jgi:16S rRNA processing protein RimM
VIEKGSESIFLTIGRILAPWGIKGEVKVQVLTDFLDSFAAQNQVYLHGGPLTIEHSRRHDKHLIIKLATIDDRGAAERLGGCDVEIPLSQAHTLPEGEYYPLQLIGLEVQTEAGEPLGEVIDIWLRESNDIYVVRGSRGEILVPAIEDVVKSIDLENGIMVIEVMNGLLE